MKHDLTHLSGDSVRDESCQYDNETCYNVSGIIQELEDFVAQYDTHAMRSILKIPLTPAMDSINIVVLKLNKRFYCERVFCKHF